MGIKQASRVLGATGLQSLGPNCPCTLGSCWHLLDMRLRVGAGAPRPLPSSGLLLLGLLLLPAVVALPRGKSYSKAWRGRGRTTGSRGTPRAGVEFL